MKCDILYINCYLYFYRIKYFVYMNRIPNVLQSVLIDSALKHPYITKREMTTLRCESIDMPHILHQI